MNRTSIEPTVLSGKLAVNMSFEEKVWSITTRIPRGQVTTYGWVARQLGGNAYRAVGRALGRNPYAPKVPCHRVVGSDGSLTGFAGGLPAKRELLKKEGVGFVGDKVDLQRFGLK